MLDQKNQFSVIQLIENNSDYSQKMLAKNLNTSLGKVNCCLKSLINKSFIKIGNSKNHDNKLQYSCLLTPEKKPAKKSKLTTDFLQHNIIEYGALKLKINELQQQVEAL